MNAVTIDVKDKLVALGQGTYATQNVSGWNIYIGLMPDTPNQVIVLYDSPAPKPLIVANNSIPDFLQSPFSVQVRAGDYEDAHAKARAVKDALQRIGRFTVGAVSYKNIIMQTDPHHLGYDGRQRSVWVFNGVAYREDTV